MRNKVLHLSAPWLIGALTTLGFAPARAQSIKTVLHSFSAQIAPQGSRPGGLTADSAGDLFGTAAGGGLGGGTVFEVDSSGNQTLLYSFRGGADGAIPNPGIIRDSAGNLYGTTSWGGGPENGGTVFKIDPANNETVLYRFTCGTDGCTPLGGLAMDASGNLYGTTSAAGAGGAGTIFKIDPAGQETVLHHFTGGADGGNPRAGLLLDGSGNLYGTASTGGIADSGVIFKLDANGVLTVLYAFLDGADGSQPVTGLIADEAGNLYGTANGGTSNDGVAFGLSPGGQFTLLHTFTGGIDGSQPGPLTRDAAGNLYGAANLGGTGNFGLVFRIDAVGVKTNLYVFSGQDGNGPQAALLLDPAGNLFGTTQAGGPANMGVIFKLASNGQETLVYSFPAAGDGANPNGTLAIDQAGNLYGTTDSGGPTNSGTVFKIDPDGNETVLYGFQGPPDGSTPHAGVTIDSGGNLYGTTSAGGAANAGTVYKLDPSGQIAVLYNFQNGADGANPQYGVTLDQAGNLYGVAGADLGVLYKVDPAGHQTVLYTFPGGPAGFLPFSNVTLDSTGSLLGTTMLGGAGNAGVIYKVDAGGQQTPLYSFTGSLDGGYPDSGVMADADGNLYGVTPYGGAGSMGTIYKLDTAGQLSVLHAPTEGRPSGRLLADPAGNFYGTLANDTDGGGVVFKLDPSGAWTNLFQFAGSDSPLAGVVRDSSGNLYGISYFGGASGAGMVYKLGFPSYSICGQVASLGSGMSGVTVALSGAASDSTTTDAGGNYCLTAAAGGDYTVTPSSAGIVFEPAGASFTKVGVNRSANFAGTCSVTVTPPSVYLDATSQSGSAVTVTAPAGCRWPAASGSSFMSVTSGSTGAGTSSVTFSIDANPTGAARTGALTAGDQIVLVTQRATADTFVDVSPADYFFDFAGLMYTGGITGGCLGSPLSYCPDRTTSREEMAVMLIAAIERGSSFTYTSQPYFTDVPPSHPYFRFIQKLRDLHITGGCAPTLFCPGAPVSRGQMAVLVMSARYGALPFTYPALPYFTDVPPSNIFFPFVQKMAQAGITGGCGSGLFCPDASLTRGQMAVFIVTGLLNQLLPSGTPLIASASPAFVVPGHVVTVTLTGVNTHFAAGTTQVVVPPTMMASNITVLSATSLTVDLTDVSFSFDPITIAVITGTEEAVLPNGFRVQFAP